MSDDGFIERTAGDLRLNLNSEPGEGRRNSLSSSYSSSSSSGLSQPSPASDSWECELDGMELDAALALACFSRAAVLECGGRERKRLKRNGSPSRVRDEGIQKDDLTFVPDDTQAIDATKEEEILIEQTSDRTPASSNCFSSYLSTSSGRKIRQNLTQAEREARRMHRVLANRESARQTIRRRQALRDELTKKVSKLSLENQHMKMEKEQVMKELMILKNKNKLLKDKLAMATKSNIMGSETTLASPERLSFSHQQHPFFVNFKPPFLAGTQPPRPVTATHTELVNEISNSDKAVEHKIVLYVPPSAWFCSLFNRMSSSCQFLSGTQKEKEVDSLTGCFKSMIAEQNPSTKEQNQRESLTIHEQSSSKENAAQAKSCKLDIDLNFNSEMSVPLFDAFSYSSRINDDPVRYTPTVNTVNKSACRTEADQLLVEQSAAICSSDAAAAARRRRKEIIKLKHQCGRPISLHN